MENLFLLTRLDRERTTTTPTTPSTLDDSFVKTYPNLYYQHRTPEFRKNYALLAKATRNPDNRGARVVSTLLRTGGNTNEESEDTLEMIFYIAKSLFPCLLPPIDKQASHQLDGFSWRISLL